jgi:NADH-quinone oxidoreductase subunit A
VAESIEASARRLVWLSLADIVVFFAVLMVGFAYVWRRGDLDWVRAVSRARAQSRPADEEPSFEEAALTV